MLKMEALSHLEHSPSKRAQDIAQLMVSALELHLS